MEWMIDPQKHPYDGQQQESKQWFCSDDAAVKDCRRHQNGTGQRDQPAGPASQQPGYAPYQDAGKHLKEQIKIQRGINMRAKETENQAERGREPQKMRIKGDIIPVLR